MLISFVCYLLHYLPEVLLASPILVWAYVELRTERQWRVVLIALTALAGVVAAVFLISRLPNAAQYIWCGDRLAPAISWIKGYQLYYPQGQGPVLVQMYGPVSAMAYLPTALASRPTIACMIGALINLSLYMIPAAWFLHSCLRLKSRAIVVASMAAFALLTSRQPVLALTSTLVTIDAPAVGIATCAFAMLVRSDPDRTGRTGAICGVLAALSLWTKLTIAPIVMALTVYAFLISDWRRASRFILTMGLAGLAVSGLFLLIFGPQLLFQNIVVPSRQPWQWAALSPVGAYRRAIQWIWLDMLPVGWILMAAVLLPANWPRFRCGAFRQWARENPWLLPLLGACFVLPTSALAYVKVGGIWNNSAMSGYMALLAAVAALAGACGSAPDRDSPLPGRLRLARVSLVTLMMASCWVWPATLTIVSRGLAGWADLGNNEHEVAFQYARQHPGEVYFPSYPLVTLMSEGRLYHFAAGMVDLQLAGFPVSEAHFQAFLPPRLKAVIINAQYPPALSSEQLSDFHERVDIPNMPGWVAMTRDGRLP